MNPRTLLLLLPLLATACAYDPHTGHVVLNAQPAPTQSPVADRLQSRMDLQYYRDTHNGHMPEPNYRPQQNDPDY